MLGKVLLIYKLLVKPFSISKGGGRLDDKWNRFIGKIND